MYSIIPFDQNPALRLKAREVPLSDIGSPRLEKMISDMKKLLSNEDYGVALAAPQIGESLKLFVVSGTAVMKREEANKKRGKKDSPSHDESTLTFHDEVYINPIMTKMSRAKKDKHEGCLSVRGKWGLVPRSEKATLRYYNENGEQLTRGASGFLAHIFQHEMDHLDGILYTDKANEIYADEDENSEKHEE